MFFRKPAKASCPLFSLLNLLKDEKTKAFIINKANEHEEANPGLITKMDSAQALLWLKFIGEYSSYYEIEACLYNGLLETHVLSVEIV